MHRGGAWHESNLPVRSQFPRPGECSMAHSTILVYNIINVYNYVDMHVVCVCCGCMCTGERMIYCLLQHVSRLLTLLYYMHVIISCCSIKV